MRIISQIEIEKSLQISAALKAIENSFVEASKNTILLPPPLVFPLGKSVGEICIKTAYDPKLPTYTVKQVSVFQKNQKRNIPTLCGTMNVYNSKTGELLAVLAENGWLTNMRTACAGAIADTYFRQTTACRLGIIGTGTQALFQLTVILSVSQNYHTIFLWNRSKIKLQKFFTTVKKTYPTISFVCCNTITKLVKNSDTILTCTSAQTPLIQAQMIQGSKTIVGIGADMPEKCEIDSKVFQKADRVFVDKKESNFILGDIAQALQAKKFTKKIITGEIGDVICGKEKGRENDAQCIIVKLVGIGAQDTYIGNYVYSILHPAVTQKE